MADAFGRALEFGRRRWRWWWAASAGFLLLLALSLFNFYERHVFLFLWEPTSVAYDASCQVNCKDVRFISTGHNVRAPLEGELPVISYNPDVDDPIAQWGDCLDSIMRCVRDQPRNLGPAVNTCVRQSQCPAKCVRRFLSDTGPSIEQAERALFTVFVRPDAVCRPAEPVS